MSRVELWEGQRDNDFAVIARGTIKDQMSPSIGAATVLIYNAPATRWEAENRLSRIGETLLSVFGPGIQPVMAQEPPETFGYAPRPLTDPIEAIRSAYDAAVSRLIEHAGL